MKEAVFLAAASNLVHTIHSNDFAHSILFPFINRAFPQPASSLT